MAQGVLLYCLPRQEELEQQQEEKLELEEKYSSTEEQVAEFSEQIGMARRLLSLCFWLFLLDGCWTLSICDELYIITVDALCSWGFEGIMGIKFDAVDETQEDSNT